MRGPTSSEGAARKAAVLWSIRSKSATACGPFRESPSLNWLGPSYSRRCVCYSPSSLKLRDSTCRTGQFQNVHAGIGAIADVNVAAIVDLNIVRLDRDLAALLRARTDAPLVGFVGNGGNVIADFLRLQWIAHVQSAHAGIEVGDKENAPGSNGGHVFIRRVGSETAAAVAEIAARFRNRPR